MAPAVEHHHQKKDRATLRGTSPPLKMGMALAEEGWGPPRETRTVPSGESQLSGGGGGASGKGSPRGGSQSQPWRHMAAAERGGGAASGGAPPPKLWTAPPPAPSRCRREGGWRWQLLGEVAATVNHPGRPPCGKSRAGGQSAAAKKSRSADSLAGGRSDTDGERAAPRTQEAPASTQEEADRQRRRRALRHRRRSGRRPARGECRPQPRRGIQSAPTAGGGTPPAGWGRRAGGHSTVTNYRHRG